MLDSQKVELSYGFKSISGNGKIVDFGSRISKKGKVTFSIGLTIELFSVCARDYCFFIFIFNKPYWLESIKKHQDSDLSKLIEVC